VRGFASTGTAVPRATNKGDGTVTAIEEKPRKQKEEEKTMKHVTFDDQKGVNFFVDVSENRKTMRFCYCVLTDLAGELSQL